MKDLLIIDFDDTLYMKNQTVKEVYSRIVF